jgi:hypothetical protein
MSFKSVQAKIAKRSGVPMKNAGAILASSSRNASPAAKRANPNLLKVKGARGPSTGPHKGHTKGAATAPTKRTKKTGSTKSGSTKSSTKPFAATINAAYGSLDKGTARGTLDKGTQY